jgi:hypothetical protein
MHGCPLCGGTGVVTLEDYARQLENRPGAVGTNHPNTSKRAAKNPTNIIRFGTQRHRVLIALRDHGPQTCATIAERLNLSRNQTATRLGECRAAGLVEWHRNEAGEIITEPTGPNDAGRVQNITQAGRMTLNQLEAIR